LQIAIAAGGVAQLLGIAGLPGIGLAAGFGAGYGTGKLLQRFPGAAGVIGGMAGPGSYIGLIATLEHARAESAKDRQRYGAMVDYSMASGYQVGGAALEFGRTGAMSVLPPGYFEGPPGLPPAAEYSPDIRGGAVTLPQGTLQEKPGADFKQRLDEYQRRMAEYQASFKGQMESMIQGIGLTSTNVAAGVMNTWQTLSNGIISQFGDAKLRLDEIFKQIAASWMHLVVDQIGKAVFMELFKRTVGYVATGGAGVIGDFPVSTVAYGSPPAPTGPATGGASAKGGSMNVTVNTIGDARYLEAWLQSANVRRVLSGMIRQEISYGY